MRPIVQYFFTGLALLLLGMGLLTAFWEFPTPLFISLGGVASVGALVALGSLWAWGSYPIKRGLGIALGALLTLSLSYSTVSGMASLILFIGGSVFLLQGLNRWAKRR